MSSQSAVSCQSSSSAPLASAGGDGFARLSLAFTPAGYLPAGIHSAAPADAERLLAFNPARRRQWQGLQRFIRWAESHNTFSCIYLDGGYVSRKPAPDDIDCILQSRAPYGPAALESMMPFFSYGLDRILKEYAVHLHFWAEGFPGGVQDFRMFFQYIRPRDAAENCLDARARKGLIRMELAPDVGVVSPAMHSSTAAAASEEMEALALRESMDPPPAADCKEPPFLHDESARRTVSYSALMAQPAGGPLTSSVAESSELSAEPVSPAGNGKASRRKASPPPSASGRRKRNA
ncbi:hypothetical protein DB346_14005 [Verrucomicrobia bacterium LW23]|nr:hypothetical protein DB346_14005 [Verrucomicrobia bacterium LW23]